MNSTQTVLNCNSCSKDAYEPGLQQILNSMKSDKQMQNSHDYQMRVCASGTQHLYLEGRKVLMAKQAYDLVRVIHSDDHLSPAQMISIAKHYPIHISNIDEFIQQFTTICPCCAQANQDKELSHPIWALVGGNFNIQPPKIMDGNVLLEKFNVKWCEGECLDDAYEKQYEVYLHLLKFQKLPPLPKGQGTQLHRHHFHQKSKKFKIITCNKGKDHVWAKTPERRVPMVNEARYLCALLHGKEHRHKKTMSELILTQKKVYPYALKKYIHQVYDQCLQCNPEVSDPKPYKWDNDEDEEDEEEIEPHQEETIRREFKNICELGVGEKQILRTRIPWEPISQNLTAIHQRINSIPLWEDPLSYKEAIANEFKVSPLAAEMAIEDLHWSRLQLQQLQNHAAENSQIMVRTIEECGILRAAILSTEAMKESYLCFGDCLSVDYVTKTVRKRSCAGRHFHVGIFSGQDEQGKMVLFGLSLLSSDLYSKKVFELFFHLMEDRIPTSIIVPDSRQTTRALDGLRRQRGYKFSLCINWFYIVQFLKKHANNELEKYKILSMFCQAMREPVPGKYREHLLSLRSQMVGTSVYFEFDKVGESFCLSKLHPLFIGFGLSTSRLQELYRILEEGLQYQPKLMMLFLNIIQIDQRLRHEPKSFAEPTEEDKEIWELSTYLHRQLYNEVKVNYLRSKSLQSISMRSSWQLEVVDDGCTYTVRYDIEKAHWKCNCRVLYLTGLPCAHLIHVVQRYRGCLKYYINSRWGMVEEPLKQEDERLLSSSSESCWLMQMDD